MSHCNPCEVCPIVDLCLQAIKDVPCPIDEDNKPTTNTNTIIKEK